MIMDRHMDMVIIGQTDYGQTYGHGDYRTN